MGNKVNPILYRLGNSTPNSSLWYTNSDSYSHFISQDLELKNFLVNLLRNRGILLRACKVNRSSQKLLIDLDLYFSYSLTKQAKFFWARSLFKTVKKKYLKINKIKDVKNFVQTLEVEDSSLSFDKIAVQKKKYVSFNKRSKTYLLPGKKPFNKKRFFSYKNRFFFFLVLKKQRINYLKRKEDIKLLSAVKSSKRSLLSNNNLVRLSLQKFSRLFVLQKFKYNFRSYYLKKFVPDSNVFNKQEVFDLLELNKNLCRSVQSFCGVEEVELNIFSNQLTYLPSFKFFQKKVFKELSRFHRNREIRKYYVECLENLYFVIRTFGFGNAYLLSCMLIFLLENMRKQVFIVKFLKKSLQVFFRTIPLEEIAVSGVKILIKGRFNKRRRTKKVVLQEGQISLQTISTPIDYYQTKAVTIYGTFGIKVWISKS